MQYSYSICSVRDVIKLLREAFQNIPNCAFCSKTRFFIPQILHYLKRFKLILQIDCNCTEISPSQ